MMHCAVWWRFTEVSMEYTAPPSSGSKQATGRIVIF
jgi:hypothetical protein